MAEQDKAPIWIKNEHGVVSCKEKWLGQKLVESHINWSYVDEPMDEKEGLEESPKEEKDATSDMGFRELQTAVKEMGINPFGKKKDDLIKILKTGKEVGFKKETIKLSDES